MANGKLNLGKQSGGVLSLTFPDGVTDTEVVLPESGTVASVDGAVTDNAVARYDGTTGKLQDSGVIIDDTGKLGIGTIPEAKLDILDVNDATVSTIFRAGISGVSNGLTISKDNVANMTFSYVNQASVCLDIDSAGKVLAKSPTGGLGYGTGAGGTVTQLTSKSTAVTLNKPCGKITTSNAAMAAGASATFLLYNNLAGDYDTSVAISKNGNYDARTVITGPGVIYVKITNVSSGSLSETVDISFVLIKGANA